MKRIPRAKINDERCAGGCGKKKPANFNRCTVCRASLPLIDTICAGCGRGAHALFCDDCQKPLVEAGRKLLAQEKYNRLTLNQRSGVRNPRYSDGAFDA